MVERFNRHISEVLTTTRFDSDQSLEHTITRYVRLYNHTIPQRALGHITPVAALKQWHQKRPEIFTNRVYNLSLLDIPRVLHIYSA